MTKQQTNNSDCCVVCKKPIKEHDDKQQKDCYCERMLWGSYYDMGFEKQLGESV